MVDLGTMESDTTPPVIFFNEYFFGASISVDGLSIGSGPFSTQDGDIFRVEIDMTTYEGPLPITKDDIISGLIYDITDNRDGSISLEGVDVFVYKDVISTNSEVDEITEAGNYMVKFNLVDTGRNENPATTIIISLI